MILLLPRFCAYVSLQTQKLINIWPHLKKFSPSPAVLGLSTALINNKITTTVLTRTNNGNSKNYTSITAIEFFLLKP